MPRHPAFGRTYALRQTHSGSLTFVWRADGATTLALSGRLPAGRCTVTVTLAASAPERAVRLLVNGQEAARRDLPASFPLAALSAGLRCGWNPGAPISAAYRGRNASTGTIEQALRRSGSCLA